MTRFLLVSTLLLLAAGAARAQRSETAGGGAGRCADGVVSAVFIDNHSIFDIDDPNREKRFDWAYRLANALHVRTRESVIARELLVRPGDCYDPLMLAESERLLRAYPFLSRVDIFDVPRGDGTRHVVVDTQDEWSTQLDVRVGFEDGVDFEGARLREINLLGTGQTLEIFYLDREANREYGIGYETPQLFGSRWDVRIAAGRTASGSFLRESIAYPFVGETGRWAARHSLRRQDRYFVYEQGDGAATELRLPVSEQIVEFALIGRAGRPGQLTTFGAALSYVGLDYPGNGQVIAAGIGDPESGLSPLRQEAAAAVTRQATEMDALRLLLVLGRRNIRWVKRRGFDSLRGEQDIRLGSELELVFGRSLPGREPDSDYFAGFSAYAGHEAGPVLTAGRLGVDSRLAFGAAASGEWRDILVDGELSLYWRPQTLDRHTLLLRAAGTGGWLTRTPYQLTLGGDLGVRGYDRYRFPGGRRVIVSAEHRSYFGWPFREVLDLGGTVFVDVGRIWPGDAPFGVDSGWRAAAGFGLRGAFPAGGRTTYRIDVAWPLTHGASWRDARLILSIGELLGLDPAIRADRFGESRQLAPAGDVFRFPR